MNHDRTLHVPDAVASQAALKKISMHNMDKLVEEMAQNLANVSFSSISSSLFQFF